MPDKWWLLPGVGYPYFEAHQNPHQQGTLMTSKSAEQMIQESGATAPRLNPQHIESVIQKEQYLFPTGTLTVCILTLRNGTLVTGEAASVSPANFNEEIGRKVAREDAFRKIWALEGYLLKERLYQNAEAAKTTIPEAHDSPVLEQSLSAQDQSILDTLIPRLAGKLQVLKDKISLDSRISEDLGADSLDMMELVMGIEDEFNIKITDDEAEKVSTVRDAVKLIASKLPSSN
jgi:acyl carrier protein